MVNAVIPLDNEKTPTYGWLQFEKKALKEMTKLNGFAGSYGNPHVPCEPHEQVKRAGGITKAIAEGIGGKRETVNRALSYLSKHNFLQIIKAGGVSVYVVNSRVAWQGERGARYAAFGADVIAIESEQLINLDDQTPLKSVPVLYDGERVLVGNEDMPPPDQQEMDLP